jgi:hypothetical protein
MSNLFSGKPLLEYKGMQVYDLEPQELSTVRRAIGKGVNDWSAAVEAATTGGMVTDSADCTYLFTDVIKSAPLPNNLVQLGLDADPSPGWASSTTHLYDQRRYIAPGAMTCCDELPLLPKQLPPTRKTYGIQTLGIAYDTCAMDHYIQCGPGGYELLRLDQDNQRLAMEALSYAASQLGFAGNSDNNVMGLANNPDIPAMRMPAFNASGRIWVNALKAALRWIRAANYSWDANMQPTKFVWALPPTVADYLDHKTALECTGDGMNVMNFFLTGGRGMNGNQQAMPGVSVRVVTIPELEWALGGCPTGLLMEDDPKLLKWIRPQFDQNLNPSVGRGGSPYVISPPMKTGHFKEETAIITRVGSIVPQQLNRIIKLQFPRPALSSVGYAPDWAYSANNGACA